MSISTYFLTFSVPGISVAGMAVTGAAVTGTRLVLMGGSVPVSPSPPPPFPLPGVLVFFGVFITGLVIEGVVFVVDIGAIVVVVGCGGNGLTQTRRPLFLSGLNPG